MTSHEKYVVMELLGPSLTTVRRTQTNQRYSVSTALRLSLMMLQSLRALHCRGFVHCDVKPSNFLFRSESENPPLVLIDYGLSKRFINGQTGQRRNKCQTSFFTGTAKYASISAQKGRDVGPVDDLISWLYSTVELVDGSLPWERERDFRKIRKKKARIVSCHLVRNLPSQFLDIIQYLRPLPFIATVNYDYLISLVTKAIVGRNAGFKCPYDWEIGMETEGEGEGIEVWGLPQGCEYLKTFPSLKRRGMLGKEHEREQSSCSVA
jgi:serine/threonine protein kinase